MARGVLRFIGMGSNRPRTRLGRAWRIGEVVLALLAGAYLLLLIFPQLAMWRSMEHGGIALYARSGLDPHARAVLGDVRRRLTSSEFHTGRARYRVYLCNSEWLYAVLAPRHRGTFAVCFPVTNHICVASADLAANRSRAFRDRNKVRPLSAVIAHEITHVMLRRELGFWADQDLPTWLKEGYCETIAGGSSFPPSLGDKLLADGEITVDPAFQYLYYRRLVEYLMYVEGRSMRSLIDDPPAERDVLRRLRRWMRDHPGEIPRAPDARTNKPQAMPAQSQPTS